MVVFSFIVVYIFHEIKFVNLNSVGDIIDTVKPSYIFSYDKLTKMLKAKFNSVVCWADIAIYVKLTY